MVETRMRGGRRPGVGGRGRGESRDLSPDRSTTRIKDRNSSGWRHDSFHQRSRRSLSPRIHGRPRRSPSRRSASIERRNYASRRSDHGKQQHHREPPLLPHSRNRPSPFEDEGFNFEHKYMLPEHPGDLSAGVNSGLKPSRSIKEKDLVAGVQKPTNLDEGLMRTLYSLPQDAGRPLNSASLNSENMRGGGGSNLNMTSRYQERFRDSYDDKEREKPYVMPPSSQLRPFGGATSSNVAVANDGSSFLGFYGDRGGIGKFSDDPVEHSGYNQVQLSGPLRRAQMSPLPRDELCDYGYDELIRPRETIDHGYLADNLYRKMPFGPRSDFRGGVSSSFLDLAGERIDRADASGASIVRKNWSESSFSDQHRSLHGDAAVDFCDLKGTRTEYAGGSESRYAGFGMKSLRDHEVAPLEESYAFGRDVGPMAYRERPTSPLLSDRPMSMFRQGVSPPRGKIRIDDDQGIYDMSPERMVRRKFVTSEDVNGLDSRNMFSDDQNAYRRMPSPSHDDEIWSNEDRRSFLPSKRPSFGRSQYRIPPNRMSRDDAWALSSDSSARGVGGRGISVMKRLRPGPSEYHGSFSSERRQDSFRPRKFWKRGLEDKHGDLGSLDADAPGNGALFLKDDPPEDSEEFKKQVHKAFLRFSKLLNESPSQQKRYRDDQGKFANLLCCVCGSLSKEFGDTHSLLTHTYHSLKLGLRTEHLGFHKALCVLMGWNWLVPPDTSKLYLSRPSTELKAVKEDLILWPPVVIVHNSSIGNKNKTNGPKVVSIEDMQEILRGMGFGAGKTRVCRGKPANQSILLVKFMPTFSGLQEAERLHKYYVDNKHGRQEFLKITSSSTSDDNIGGASTTNEDCLYGYMAVAEDLDKLNPETKKRCLVKSRKDIEAIADAPLNTD